MTLAAAVVEMTGFLVVATPSVMGVTVEGRTGVPLEMGQVVMVTVVSTEVRVQGQSVTVTVPGAVTTMVLLPSVRVVASGQ